MGVDNDYEIDSWARGAESEKAGTGNLRQPFVACVGDQIEQLFNTFAPGDQIEQLFNTFAPDRRDDAKLGKMRADRIDHCGLLANERALSRR
jgi:hypothetical protein